MSGAAPGADPEKLLMALFGAAVGAARPENCLPAHLPPAPQKGRLILLAAGKAGAAMAATAIAHYRGTSALIEENRLAGLVTTRHGYGRDTAPLPLIEAGHPLPDAGSAMAAGRALDIAADAGPDDLVLVLMSGGGSALWSAPIAPLTLNDKQAITTALLRSGATIAQINCVRKHLSSIKGGRLAMAARRARIVTLAISDVPGDDPSAIASGPTVPDPATQGEALAICEHYAIALPASARTVLTDPANESLKQAAFASLDARYEIVAAPAASLEAAARLARAAGLEPVILGAALEGEARDLGAAHARLALKYRADGKKVVLLSGGEVTVTVTGEGRGGPNQEYALALAIGLNGASGIHAIACDTDGTDGGSGAIDDPAGAMIGPDILNRALEKHLDPAEFLRRNDSTGFFLHAGGLVNCGPSFTNVNDFRAIVII